MEWPARTNGPVRSRDQSCQKAARSLTHNAKSSMCPVTASAPSRPDPAWPRQSAAVTRQPCVRQ